MIKYLLFSQEIVWKFLTDSGNEIKINNTFESGHATQLGSRKKTSKMTQGAINNITIQKL